MKRKSYGLGTKIILVLLFFMGLCMIANLAFVFGETEEVEGIVEHTYYVQVDAKMHRIPKRSAGEGIVAVIMGVVMCAAGIVIWRKKFGKPKKQAILSEIEQRRREAYDLQTYLPVIRCSICNGEQVAGFKDKRTGQFTEVMLIRNDKDLEEFKVRYGVEKVTKEY